MTNLHYEFTGETTVNRVGLTLHRIRATRDLPHFGVKTGDEGGWIEHTGNLSGEAWVDDEAQVSGGAEVYGNAWVFGEARVSSRAKVFGTAKVFGSAQVFDSSEVFGTAKVFDSSEVFGTAKVFGNAQVFGSAQVFDSSEVPNDAHIESNADYFHAVTYTSTPLLLTLTRQKADKHLIRMGYWSGTIDEFEDLITQPKRLETVFKGSYEARPEMEILASLMRARIERWK